MASETNKNRMCMIIIIINKKLNVQKRIARIYTELFDLNDTIQHIGAQNKEK